MKKLCAVSLFLLLAVPASAAAPRILPSQDAWPVWSPDGTKIAFTRVHAARPLSELLVVDVKTKRVTRLAQSSYRPAPSWSPDGTRIAYQAGGDVYVTDLRGMTRRVGKGTGPAFGDRLARIVGGTLTVDGRPWATNAIGQPAWAPDRKRIAFQRADGIYVTDGVITTSWANPGPEPGPPSWSNDGTQIAFAAGDAIYVAAFGPLPPRKIATGRPNASTPSWSPAGDAVVYSWQRGVTLTTTGGRSRLLHAPAGLGAAFSPKADVVAWAGPRPACPGHIAIRIRGPLTGSCELQGTPGADVIEGSSRENDVILARGGNDKVHANDRHTDRVDCGPGRDEVWADQLDKLARCEVIHR